MIQAHRSGLWYLILSEGPQHLKCECMARVLFHTGADLSNAPGYLKTMTAIDYVLRDFYYQLDSDRPVSHLHLTHQYFIKNNDKNLTSTAVIFLLQAVLKQH